jgi:geranylgeranyl diphosphate synthase type I
MAIATENATAAQLAVLGRVGAPDLTDDEVAAIQDVLIETGALSELESQIDALATEALSSLDSAPLSDDARKGLDELARYVAWREA